MRKDLVDITLVVDRSGSMASRKSDAEGGINTFIEDQKNKEGGEALFTLVQFDTEYEFVHKGKNIKEIPRYVLQPRGNTALLDAVGRSITEVGSRLEKMEEAARPGCVIFVIVTDGHENASREFNNEKIKEMIERQKNEYGWQFIFLGADATSFDGAVNMGISANAAAIYNADEKSREAYDVASGKVCSMREELISGGIVCSDFSAEEREEIS